jgi:16S rRNA processing protein RimM
VEELQLGSINGSHGIKGWVKVFSYTDPMEAILTYSPWIIRRGSTEQQITIVDGKVSGKRLIVQFDGIDTRELADELNGYEIHIEKTRLPELENADYYWHQLQGFTVVNKQGILFGELDHLLETGANDVIVVRATQQSIDDKQRLIPYVESTVVQSVDRDAGQILVDWDAEWG